MLAVGGLAALLFLLGLVCGVLSSAVAIVRRKDPRALRSYKRAAISSFFVCVASLIVFAIVAVIATPPTSTTSVRVPPSNPASPTVLQYVTLRPGLQLSLDSPEANGILFDSLDTAKRWAMGRFTDDGKPDGPSDLPHKDVPIGALVAVETWAEIPQLAEHNKRLIVKVRESAGAHREGWADGIFLVPLLPAGSTLVAYAFRGPALMTTSELKAKKTTFLELKSGTRVSLIKTIVNGDLDHFYGRVITGPYTGRQGWLSTLDARLLSPPIITDDGDYYPNCSCVSLYVKPGWKPGMPTPAPSETPTASGS